jgi:hypothetical protein
MDQELLMIKNTKIQRFICQCLCALMITANLQGLAVAGMVTNHDLQKSEQATQRLNAINNMITRTDIRDALITHGVSPDEVMERVNHMSDAELAALHNKLDQIPVGQGALETVLLVFIILILLDLTGVTDIFPRI